MKTKKILMVVAVVLSLGMTTSWACRVAGPNKHVGQVTNIDTAKNSFTLMDAELQKPITFQAKPDLIKELEGVKGQVMVSYQEEEGELMAMDIHH